MKLTEDYKSPTSEIAGKEAFSILYKRYFTRLKLFAFKFVYDQHKAEDLVHDVFISIWENKHVFDLSNHKKLEHYLFKSVKNNCTTFLKRDGVQREHRNRIMVELLNSSTNHFDHMVNKELSDKIRDIVNTLPKVTRKIFTLSRLDGLKNRQIADKLNMSEKNIEYHLSKTIKIFKQKLHKYVGIIVLIITLLK